MGQRKPGKREPGQADVNAALSGSNDDGYLLYVHDDKSKRRWLIDSGALLSIIPPTLEQKRDGPNGIKLSAANGTEIPCYGTELVDVAFGGRIFPTTVTVADVRQPILGADFLAANHLAPDQRYGNLIDLETWEIIDAHFDKCSSPTRINYVDQRNDPYYQLLDKYPELSVPQFRPDKVKHNVKHYIPQRVTLFKQEPESLIQKSLQWLRLKLKNWWNLESQREPKANGRHPSSWQENRVSLHVSAPRRSHAEDGACAGTFVG